MKARAIAFYLPQFHPTPENDEWWGPGFTEWTNVARARPLFRGHPQPKLPGQLGFYDLRLAETREAQARLARQYGVEAFCYWHYWFGNGRRILDRPFREVLEIGKPDHGFCLGWANHTWSGVWDGAPNRILIEQTYPGVEDEKRHFDAITPAFHDRRYVKVEGKPLFYVFRPYEIPNPNAFCEHWRDLAERAGLPGIHLVAEVSDLLGSGPKCPPPEELGFDAGVYVRMPVLNTPYQNFLMRFRRKFLGWPEAYWYSTKVAQPPKSHLSSNLYPCVYPNWDNTPRSGRRGLVIRGSSPQKFAAVLSDSLIQLAAKEPEHRFLFIKSWNEWAEGNYLEPDRDVGQQFGKVLSDLLN